MMKGCAYPGQAPGLLRDISATAVLAVTTMACGGGIATLLALTTTYTLLTDSGARKSKAD